MFDGLKFKCETFDLRHLDTLPIEPEMCVGFRTGELKRITAECDGFLIEVIQVPETGRIVCRFRGSLHRYANGGAANVGVFTFPQVCGAVDSLCQRFGIDPKTARLENVELGFEIRLPIPARQFISTLICHGNKPFQPLNIKKPHLGRVLPRQEYDFKIYDKGRQAATGEANLIRVEIQVSKMAYLKPYGIATLSDLTDPDKVRPLGRLLQSVFDDVICYDRSVPETELSTREQMHLKDVCNPNWWADLNNKERWKQRQRFALWVQQHGANKLFISVVSSMVSHWENLLSVTRINGDFLSNFSTDAQKQKGDFLSRMLSGQKVTLEGDILFLPETEKNDGATPSPTTTTPPQNKRSFFPPNFCRCCGRDISTQRQKSRYCSESNFGATARRCRDKAHNERRREAARIEVERFEAMLPDLPAMVLSLTVFALDSLAPDVPALYAVANLTHGQVYGKPYPGIRQARRVDLLTTSGKRLTFTRSFAKRLLSFLASTPPAIQPPPPGVPPAKPLPQPGKVDTVGKIANKIFDNLIND